MRWDCIFSYVFQTFEASMTFLLSFAHAHDRDTVPLMAILWPAEKEAVSHTVRAWKTRGNVELDGPKVLERVWVGYFLSHRTLKIPSSINKPCLLSRRFFFSPGNGERLVMNRKGPWDEFSLAFCLLPAFLYAHIFIETETSG